MDIFIEYLIKRKKGAKEIIIILAVLLSLPSLMVLALLLNATPVAPMTLIVEVALIYLAYFIITRLNVEFEYIITNNEMDIDKITARKTRKRLITIDLRKIDCIAPVMSEAHLHEMKMPATNVIYADSGMANGSFFMNFTRDGQTYKVFFTPSSKMIEGMKVFAPGKVFEE